MDTHKVELDTVYVSDWQDLKLLLDKLDYYLRVGSPTERFSVTIHTEEVVLIKAKRRKK